MTAQTNSASPRPFYSRHSQQSDPGTFRDEILTWPRDVAGLLEVIQGLLIYDAVAKPFYGCDLTPERQDDIHTRTAEQILAKARALDGRPLVERRAPGTRVAARCNNFSLLLVSALRTHGVPARLRCGYGTYFNPGYFEDHWICEYCDDAGTTWKRADAQFDAVWKDNLGIAHEVTDLPDGAFLDAAQTWQGCRTGAIDPDKVGVSFIGQYGLPFAAGSLVRDLAALARHEMHPWDVWGTQPAPDAHLTDEQLGYFDGLAAMIAYAGHHPETLLHRYETDPALKVPAEVFNAVRNKMEPAYADDPRRL